MMDKIEQGTFRWFEDLIDVFGELLFDLSALLNYKPAAWQKDMAFTRDVIYQYGPSTLDLGKHYLQAIKMRTLAVQEGNLAYYCASTYALCHDWRKTADSVRWLDWGGASAFGDPAAQFFIVMVASSEPTEEYLAELLACAGKDPDRTISDYVKRGFIELNPKTKRYVPGAKAPIPMPLR